MITRTSRELIKNARYLAGLRNSDITDFYTNVLLLNNAYTQVYIDSIQQGDIFCKEINIKNGDTLPADCLYITGIYLAGVPFVQYKIINNTFTTDYNKEVTLRYAIIPATLTAPDKNEKLDIPVYATDFVLTDNYLYYTADGSMYKYDLTEKTITEETYEPITSYLFNDVKLHLTDGKVVDEDGNSYFGDKTVVDFNTSNNYAFVSYSDGSILIWTDFEHSIDYNYNCIKGRKTTGVIKASCTNDITGKGVIYYDYNSLYYGSFTPDTVISWPNNVLFQLIEYRLAVVLLGLIGLDSSAIEKQYKDLLIYFYKTIDVDAKPEGIVKYI